jgi:hypothetical protein
MADDKSKRGKPDRSRAANNDGYEVSEKLNKAAEKL